MEKPKLPGIITTEYLKSLGACSASVEYWNERWPHGAPLNDDTIREVLTRGTVFVDWAASRLRELSPRFSAARDALARDRVDAWWLRRKLYAFVTPQVDDASRALLFRLIRVLRPALRESTVREHFDVVDGATSV